jgi:hypothetical protein
VGRVPFLVHSIVEHPFSNGRAFAGELFARCSEAHVTTSERWGAVAIDYSAMSACCSLQDEYYENSFSYEIRSGIPSVLQLLRGHSPEKILLMADSKSLLVPDPSGRIACCDRQNGDSACVVGHQTCLSALPISAR